MIRYEITHNDGVLHTLTTEKPDAGVNMMNLMLNLSDENAGVFTLWRVENDPETGREKPTLIGASKNGVEI